MKIRIALATGTALSVLLLSATAMADGNRVGLKQTGDDNDALISQDGSNNTAGSVTVPASNIASTTWGDSFILRQNGDHNNLDVNQTGNGNTIALNNQYDHDGVLQQDDRNVLTISQTASGTYAGNNVGTVKQVGAADAPATANTATITQTASGRTNNGHNNVGQVTQRNLTGNTIASDANSININQNGGGFNLGNTVGYRVPYAGQHNLVEQDGANNDLVIDQDGVQNAVGTVRQLGTANVANLTQDNASEFQALGYEPVVNGSFPAQEADAKKYFNTISEIYQNGSGNEITGKQDGTRNITALIKQTGTDNESTINLIGDDNGGIGGPAWGIATFDPWSAAGAAAGDNPLIQGLLGAASITYAGVEQATVLQNGMGNTQTYTATGMGNLYGFNQDGDGNHINGVATGDDNAVAVVQFRDGNTANFAQDGDRNDTGIFQQGDLNYAVANVDGDDNHAAIGQYGDSNQARVKFTGDDNVGVALQALGDSNKADLKATGNDNILVSVQGDGDSNHATVTVTGNDNIAGAVQVGGGNESTILVGNSVASNNNAVATLQVGSTNHANVTLNGSNNNQPLLTAFSGDANTVAGLSAATINSVSGLTVPLIGGQSLLQPGLISQVGSNNYATMTVTGDSNLFATLQDGDGNHLTHTISGSSNQFAALQNGNGNVSVTVQNGVGNNIGVIQ